MRSISDKKSVDKKLQAKKDGADKKAVLILDSDDENIIENLDVLLNMEELEQSDFWDELMNLVEIDTAALSEERSEN